MSHSLPPKVLTLAAGDSLHWIWRNGLGGMTFRADHLNKEGSINSRFIKWQPLANISPDALADVDLLAEADKLRWARRYLLVPHVLEVGRNEDESWLVTQAIPSISAVDSHWKEGIGHHTPENVVRAMATGLRKLHELCPAAECPYTGSWYNINSLPAPSPEDWVVCHGDACVPNTLMNNQGNFVGLVDLARLGVADRWSDLAIATYSISWDMNFGRDYDALFFDTYGIAPNVEKINIYRALWDAV